MAEHKIDFTTLTEEDPESALTVTADKVTFVKAGDVSGTRWSVGELVASYQIGNDFTIRCNWNNDFSGTISAFNGFGAVETHVALNDIVDDSIIATKTAYEIFTQDTGTDGTFFVQEVLSGVSQGIDSVAGVSTGVKYFEAVKTATDLTLDAWTDSGKGTHVAGFPLTFALTNDVLTTWLYGVTSLALASLGAGSDGYMENMFVDFGGNGGIAGTIFDSRIFTGGVLAQ